MIRTGGSPLLTRGAVILGIAVLSGSACSPHEFKDPTSATTEVLYVKPAPSQGAPAAVPMTDVTRSTLAPGAAPRSAQPERLQPQPLAPESDSVRVGRRDTLELVSGDRIEGVVTLMTPTTVIIETGGQATTFERAKIKSIYVAPR